MSNKYSDEQFKRLFGLTIEEDQIELPAEFHKRVQETLHSLPGRKTVKKRLVPLIAAAILILLSAMVACGNDISFDTIIEFFKGSPALSESSDVHTYAQYSQSIGKIVSNSGITVTIDGVACDEDTLVIFYTAEGDKSQISESTKNPGMLKTINGVLGKCIINGHQVRPRLSRETTYLTLDGRVKGMCCADISRESLPDEFEVKYEVFSALNKEGVWYFDFSVSKANAMKDSKIFEPDQEYAVKFPEYEHHIKVEKVSFTPFGNSIVISEKFLTPPPDGVSGLTHFAIFDNKGNSLDYSFPDLFTMGEKDARNTFDFVKGSKDMKYLKLVPVDPKFNRAVNIKNPVADMDTFPLELKVSDKGSIQVEKVERSDTETRVYYTRKGFIANWGTSGSDFFFVDEQGRNAFDNNDPLQYEYVSDREKGVYVCILPALDRNKTYKIGCHKDGSYDYYEDQAIIIPLN